MVYRCEETTESKVKGLRLFIIEQSETYRLMCEVVNETRCQFLIPLSEPTIDGLNLRSFFFFSITLIKVHHKRRNRTENLQKGKH
jgi:hypothetical protein